jgi:hypothetical protein
MLPLSVRLRATNPVRADAVSMPRDWLVRCERFRIDGPNGRLGTVSAVGRDAGGEPAWLEVRTGLFSRQTIVIGFADIEVVNPAAHRLMSAIDWDSPKARR